MGHQIDAGDREISFTDGAWLVVLWCERFTPTVKPAQMSDEEWYDATCGVTQLSAKSAQTANEQIPHTFREAKEKGLLDGHYRRGIDERAFRECREFLTYAAENGLSISGSY